MAKLDEDYPGNMDIQKELTDAELIEKLKNTPVPSSIYNHTDEKKEGLYPSEISDLPSRGLCYPTDNPLSTGKIELKYMTAREEDILTSQNLIQKGIMIDKLLKSLILTKINYNDLLIGDKHAIMVATRIMAYGKDYPIEIKCPNCNETNNLVIDLQTIDDKEIDFDKLNRDNLYDYTLPASKARITFKLLTVADEELIEQELRGLKKIQDTSKKTAIDKEFTTRLKYILKSVNDNTDSRTIRDFVDNMLSRDTLEFRKYLNSITPTLDMGYDFECGHCDYEKRMRIPMQAQFFWPDSDI